MNRGPLDVLFIGSPQSRVSATAFIINTPLPQTTIIGYSLSGKPPCTATRQHCEPSGPLNVRVKPGQTRPSQHHLRGVRTPTGVSNRRLLTVFIDSCWRSWKCLNSKHTLGLEMNERLSLTFCLTATVTQSGFKYELKPSTSRALPAGREMQAAAEAR